MNIHHITFIAWTFLYSLNSYAETMISLSSFLHRQERTTTDGSIAINSRHYFSLLGVHHRLTSGITVGLKGLYRQVTDTNGDQAQTSSAGISLGYMSKSWFGSFTSLRLLAPKKTWTSGTNDTKIVQTGDDGNIIEIGYGFSFKGGSVGPSLYYANFNYAEETIDGEDNAGFSEFSEKNIHPLIHVTFDI